MPVVPKEGGPWTLFCTDCKTWTPNTANVEMQKEGYFAHSHICGHLSEDEVSDEKWQAIVKETEARRKENAYFYRENIRIYFPRDGMGRQGCGSNINPYWGCLDI